MQRAGARQSGPVMVLHDPLSAARATQREPASPACFTQVPCAQTVVTPKTRPQGMPALVVAMSWQVSAMGGPADFGAQ